MPVGIDFGTTNSALAVATGDEVKVAGFSLLGQSTHSFRSVLYITDPDYSDGAPEILAGPMAIERYLEEEAQGRLVQSLKSFLASGSFRTTNIYGRVLSLEELVAMLVRPLKKSAEEQF